MKSEVDQKQSVKFTIKAREDCKENLFWSTYKGLCVFVQFYIFKKIYFIYLDWKNKKAGETLIINHLSLVEDKNHTLNKIL